MTDDLRDVLDDNLGAWIRENARMITPGFVGCASSYLAHLAPILEIAAMATIVELAGFYPNKQDVNRALAAGIRGALADD